MKQHFQLINQKVISNFGIGKSSATVNFLRLNLPLVSS